MIDRLARNRKYAANTLSAISVPGQREKYAPYNKLCCPTASKNNFMSKIRIILFYIAGKHKPTHEPTHEVLISGNKGRSYMSKPLKYPKHGHFYNNLRNLRKWKHMTQEQLGDIIGVTFKTISDWENMMKDPRENNFLKICEFFNIDADQMCNRIYNPETGEWENPSNNRGSNRNGNNVCTENGDNKNNGSDDSELTIQLCLLIAKLSVSNKALFLQVGKKLFNEE